jgi:hypothetical protein
MRSRRVRSSNGATNYLSVRLYTAQYALLTQQVLIKYSLPQTAAQGVRGGWTTYATCTRFQV